MPQGMANYNVIGSSGYDGGWAFQERPTEHTMGGGMDEQASLVPKSTQSLISGAQQERQRQARAYDADKRRNQSQMDSVRRAQYSKQNRAVNQQRQHMSNNAAKSSRKVTGSSDYYKG